MFAIRLVCAHHFPMQNIAQKILDKYKGQLPTGRLLPVLSNQKTNTYLKEIGDVCGIKKNVTFHAEMVAARIKELRDQYGHTQEFLIDKVGLGINQYAMLERVPTLMSLRKICSFYDITLSEFFMPINLPPKTGKEVERMPEKK